MAADQPEQQRGEHPDVEGEGPGQGDRPHEVAAPPERPHPVADHGQVVGDVGHHRGGPIRGLIPGQHRPGDGHRQHQEEEHHAADPVELARLLVAGGDEGAQCVHADEQHQDVGAPEMDATDPVTEEVVGAQVQQAAVGVGDRGDVVEEQEDAGEELDDDHDQGRTAQGVGPPASLGDRLVQPLVEQPGDAGAIVEPGPAAAEGTDDRRRHQPDEVALLRGLRGDGHLGARGVIAHRERSRKRRLVLLTARPAAPEVATFRPPTIRSAPRAGWRSGGGACPGRRPEPGASIGEAAAAGARQRCAR